MTHKEWWIKGGGTVGSCGYVNSKKTWAAALRNNKVVAKPASNSVSMTICQMIVEDILNHLINNEIISRTQASGIRDKFISIVSGKLHA